MENNYENIRLPWPDWRIVRYLGGGAYGKVYEIERNISGIREKAALKIISRPKDSSEMESYYDNGYDQASIAASYESEIQNYVKEYKLMRELQGQSNIVSCDDFTVIPHKNGIGGDVFLRMELLTSLQQVLRERTLSEGEIIKLGKDISRALILCESKNIVHRDIKPVNIMISQFGDYKLGDFGVSKIMDHSTFGTAMGTPEYQAPEVVHMEKYGHTADIYSLGITLYWLLNNRKMPFIGADDRLTPMAQSEAAEKRYRGERLPAPKYGSARLKQIVLKACEYRPEDRYASAMELYEALDTLGTGAASESGSSQRNRNVTERADIHQTLSIDENEIGTNKTIRVQYPDGGERSYEVNIPAGVRDGQSLRLKGLGAGGTGEQAGDLYLDVVVSGKNEETWNSAQTEGNSWGESFGTIGSPRPKVQKAGPKKAEDFSESTIGIKNAAKKKNEAKQQKNTSESANHTDAILKKISSYGRSKFKSTGDLISSIALAVLLCVPIIGAGCVIISFGSVGFVMGPIIVYLGLRYGYYLFHESFNSWIKENKKNVPNIDDLIKNNSEFARRLYYQKCPNKHLLDYMQTLNPVVVNEIRASKK